MGSLKKHLQTRILFFLCFLALFSCKQIGIDLDSSNSSTSANNSASIISIGPSERASGVPINRTISVTFSKAVDIETLTTNTEDSVCSGNFQVSGDHFSSCVIMSGPPLAGNSNRSFVFTPVEPLDDTTDYDIKVTTGVKDTSGETISSAYVSGRCFTSGSQLDQTAPAVSTITPFNLYERMPLNTSIMVSFDETMKIPTLTTTTSGTTCQGSVQLSFNHFVTCVQMIGDPEPAADRKTFVLTPVINLAENRAYQLKVTTAATDSSGNALASAYILTRGLTTGTALDLSAPTVMDITPTNGFDNISLSTPVTVRFSERMNPVSINGNISGSSCANTIHVSTDDFASCVRTRSDMLVVNGGRSFSFYPVSEFSTSTHYTVKVTVSARDLAGNLLIHDYNFASGYDTTMTAWDFAYWDSDLWTD
jgi:hypothetical protein